MVGSDRSVRVLAATAVVSAALGVAGCGGSGAGNGVQGPISGSGGSARDRAAVERTTTTFFRGLAAAHGAVICRLMTPALSRQFIHLASEQDGSIATCSAATRLAAGQLGDTARKDLSKLTIRSIDISGTQASVKTSQSGGSPTKLVKTGGHWLLSSSGNG